MTLPAHVPLTIVGSGFAGLGLAIRLRQAGITDFVVLERGDDVGGTWRDNTYPGAACDVPSHLYCFSFAPNPDWSHSFSPQPEIQAYLRRCADRFGVRPHLRLGHEFLGADWDADRWVVRTDRGSFTTDILVPAVGALSEPSVPALPGLDRFAGTVFHSARWRHDHDLTGRRVAVVGTGASSIQFVPQIQPAVAHLDVYQRTPPWIIPRVDREIADWERALYRLVPPAQRLVRSALYWGREMYVLGFTVDTRIMALPRRLALGHLARQVPDRELRKKLTPSYTIGCKRILISSDYYPALMQPNVDLVTGGIAEIRERSIVAADGTERPADTIIFGTGFHVTDMPVGSMVRGRDGRTLAELWQGSPTAYRGTTVAGFPNMFLLVGPNTGLGHTSQVFMIEAQNEYVLGAIRHLRSRAGRPLEVRADAQRRYNDAIQRAMTGTVWTAGGCASWYIDANGRNTTLWPGATWRFRQQMRRFDPDAYVEAAAVRPEGVPATV